VIIGGGALKDLLGLLQLQQLKMASVLRGLGRVRSAGPKRYDR
jgi:hypothetical protein